MSAASPNRSMQRKHTTKSMLGKSMQGVRGFTLIELMLVLTLVTTLLASTISLMTIVKRSDHQARRSFQNRQDIRRFADDVRRDLRSASNVQIRGKDVLIGSQSQTTQTTYKIRPGTSIARVVVDSDQDSATQETYGVGIGAEIEVKWLEQDRLIQWTITDTNQRKQPIEIVSALRNEPK